MPVPVHAGAAGSGGVGVSISTWKVWAARSLMGSLSLQWWWWVCARQFFGAVPVVASKCESMQWYSSDGVGRGEREGCW